MKPETKQRSSNRLHLLLPQKGKRKPPCPTPVAKSASSQIWRGRNGGSAIEVAGTNAQQVGI